MAALLTSNRSCAGVQNRRHFAAIIPDKGRYETLWCIEREGHADGYYGLTKYFPISRNMALVELLIRRCTFTYQLNLQTARDQFFSIDEMPEMPERDHEPVSCAYLRSDER